MRRITSRTTRLTTARAVTATTARSYNRPYVFRPRFTIGFGIYAGYPVPYTIRILYPINVYGYRAPNTAVMVGPERPAYGGVALEMTPYDADVWSTAATSDASKTLTARRSR